MKFTVPGAVRNSLCSKLFPEWTNWTNKCWRGKWRHSFTNWQQRLRVVSCLPGQKCFTRLSTVPSVCPQITLLPPSPHMWTSPRKDCSSESTDMNEQEEESRAARVCCRWIEKEFKIKWVCKQYWYSSLSSSSQFDQHKPGLYWNTFSSCPGRSRVQCCCTPDHHVHDSGFKALTYSKDPSKKKWWLQYPPRHKTGQSVPAILLFGRSQNLSVVNYVYSVLVIHITDYWSNKHTYAGSIWRKQAPVDCTLASLLWC